MDNPSVLPYSLEWWHLIVSLALATVGLLGLGLRAFATGFRAWADKLEALKGFVENRLDHMEKEFTSRMVNMENKFSQHENRVHNLTIHVERRVTWLEASLYRDGRLPAPPNTHPDPHE